MSLPKADTSFGIIPWKPPFEKVTILRRHGDQPKRLGRASHPDDIIALMNAPLKYEPVEE